MAINPQDVQALLAPINELFDALTMGKISPDQARWLREHVISVALGDVEKLIVRAQPPSLYLVGRGGHGKSSLVNALAGKEVRAVDEIVPTTPKTEPVTVSFPEASASWTVYDTRGLFHATLPEGATDVASEQYLTQDLLDVQPDVLLHVIKAEELRNFRNDLDLMRSVRRAQRQKLGAVPPTILVLSKVDSLGKRYQWPPESSPEKMGLITRALDYAQIVFGVKGTPLNPGAPHQGIRLAGGTDNYAACIPVCTQWGDLWNMQTLAGFVGEGLPESKQLFYYQGLKRRHLLIRMADSLVWRFTGIAAVVGATPVPLADISILTPLQLLLVALVAGLSCRKSSLETVAEFAAAGGVSIVSAVGFREVARQVIKLVPGVGNVVSGAVAGAGTYAIGKAAVQYFFHGQRADPKQYLEDGKRIAQQILKRGP